jgi:hypothetical protein
MRWVVCAIDTCDEFLLGSQLKSHRELQLFQHHFSLGQVHLNIISDPRICVNRGVTEGFREQ